MLPTETLLDILADLDRRDFDVLELINRALGSLIAAKFDDAPRRVITLIFCVHGQVVLTCPSDGWRRMPMIELSRYLPRSVIRKLVFKWAHTFSDLTYQALLPCRAYLAADAVCDFRSMYVFHPDILLRALTEVFTCKTFVFAEHSSGVIQELRCLVGAQQLLSLPCLANCMNLQIADYDEAFFDANSALEWLLGTHAAAAGVRHLSVGETDYRTDFLTDLVVAIEQQFIRASTSASLNVQLVCFFGSQQAFEVGATRELENTETNERLEVVVDANVRTPEGKPTFNTMVTIQRKPNA